MNAKPSTSKKSAKSGTSVKRAEPQPAAVAKADRNFLRPASGAVVARFDGRGNKGVDFAGSTARLSTRPSGRAVMGN
jgi:lipoprotein NlpD